MDGVNNDNDDHNDISKTILLATPKAIVLVSKVFDDDDNNDSDANDQDDDNDEDDNDDDNDDSNDQDDTFGEDTGERAPLFDKLVKLRREAKGDLSSITIL